MENNKFYASGFPNDNGKYRITEIIKFSKHHYDISLGSKRGFSYIPIKGIEQIKFQNHTGKLMTAYAVHAIMSQG